MAKKIERPMPMLTAPDPVYIVPASAMAEMVRRDKAFLGMLAALEFVQERLRAEPTGNMDLPGLNKIRRAIAAARGGS